MRSGLLLVNLGTPDAPDTRAVRRYLREFLSDPRVIDAPAAVRGLLLNLVILPFRPARSAEAYRRVWTTEGSPLLVNGRALESALRLALGPELPVALGMRYGQPSLESALRGLVADGVDRVVVLPLFPQHSSAAWGSAVERVYTLAAGPWNALAVDVVPPFHGHDGFLEAVAVRSREVLVQAPPQARVVFSFHGLPVRHCTKSDPTGEVCARRADCCEVLGEANRLCYRAQCFATARALADRLGLVAGSWEVAFQSRLGRDPWIQPALDERVKALPAEGVKDVVVVSPSFVADCLETLEEVALRAEADFRAAGGSSLRLVPSLNAHPRWVEAVADLVRPHLWA